MDSAVKRFFKPKVSVRSVDLAAPTGTTPGQSAKCEVIEYDIAIGMEQWNDSVFMQEFEEFIATVPAPLTVTSSDRPQNKIAPDLIDISAVLRQQTR